MAVAKYNNTLKRQICNASHQMSNAGFPLYINDCVTLPLQNKSHHSFRKTFKKNIQIIGTETRVVVGTPCVATETIYLVI